MPQFGSNPSVASQNFSATQDANGNSIISSDNAFGASPLGVAARTQTLYGIPNANFDLTCPDPTTAVAVNNSIPYWSLETNGTITTTMVYNTTAQNWSVRMDPTGAAAADYAILKTRTYLLNDDAIALRQKAYASLTKQGTTGTAQWSIVLSATYYDDTGAVLSTYNIGTAADTGTWTGINGITTSGSAAISTSAAYADIALTLTAAGSVSGTAKVDVNSVLIATSQSATSSFKITQTFLSSGTWTRPTGVDYVDVAMVSGGYGGGRGGYEMGTVVNRSAQNGSIGYGGSWAYLPNIYIGDVSTVSVGVGAGGAGAAGTTFTKAAGVNTKYQVAEVTVGAAGGASSFGGYFSVAGGLTSSGGTATFNVFGGTSLVGTGSSGFLSPYSYGAPYTLPITTGGTGFSGSVSNTSGTANYGSAIGAGGTISGVSGLAGQGSAGGGVQGAAPTPTANAVSPASGGGGGAGGGGAVISQNNSTGGPFTMVVKSGAGGNAVANSGASGGGSGGALIYVRGADNTISYLNSTLTCEVGKGGDGAAGFVVVSWIG